MKDFLKLVVVTALCLSGVMGAKAEEKPQQFTNITIIQRNGRVNEDGSITYATTKRRVNLKDKSISIYCYDPGDLKCPAEVTILVTIVSGVSSDASLLRAIDIIKKKIETGESKGQLVHDDVLYQWEDGVLYKNGAFEMNLVGKPFNAIMP